jgi:FCS type zinc finger protein
VCVHQKFRGVPLTDRARVLSKGADGVRRLNMETVTCEHCGKVTPKKTAERLVVEGWTHYFCSERCKIQSGEQDEIEEDE